MIIADSFNLDLSFPTHHVSIRYLNIAGESNLVIDLITVSISIVEENIISSKFSIVKNNKEEVSFIKDISYAIKSINIANLSDTNKLEEVTNTLTSKIEYTWRINSKRVNITRHSKN